MINKKANIDLYLMLMIFSIVIWFALNLVCGINCKVSSKLDFNSDTYCKEYYTSNLTNSLPSYVKASHKQDIIDAENNQRAWEEQKRIAEQNRLCYEAGKDVAYSFDIKQSYGYNCQKLAYINDHFVDKTRQVDGGYIEGHQSGFGIGIWGFGYSSGYIEGQLYDYVTERVSATGMLVQNISYHLNCNQIKSNEVIDYYTESEFVMYYVDNCIN